MIFKNSIKLLVSNFSTFWKLLLYKFIVIAITVGLFCVSLGYLNSIPAFADFLNNSFSFLSTTLFASTPYEIMTELFVLFENLIALIGDIFVVAPAIVFYIAIVFFVVFPFLWHISDIAVSEVLFGYMASQTKLGFTGSLIRNLRIETNYSWFFALIILPFNLFFLCGMIGLLYLTTIGGLFNFFLPFITFIFILIYFSLRFTIFNGWSSAITTTSCGIFTGLSRSFEAVCRKFTKVWSINIIFVFVFMVLIFLTSLFGLLILLPLLCLLLSIFGMVMFFENTGMRYYIDNDSIREPKKLEQTDNIKKLKYII